VRPTLKVIFQGFIEPVGLCTKKDALLVQRVPRAGYGVSSLRTSAHRGTPQPADESRSLLTNWRIAHRLEFGVVLEAIRKEPFGVGACRMEDETVLPWDEPVFELYGHRAGRLRCDFHNPAFGNKAVAVLANNGLSCRIQSALVHASMLPPAPYRCGGLIGTCRSRSSKPHSGRIVSHDQYRGRAALLGSV
jgi:hypothetical protein